MRRCCYCKKEIEDETSAVQVGRSLAHKECRENYWLNLKKNVAEEDKDCYVCFYCGKLVSKTEAVHIMAARYAHHECLEKYGTHDDEEIDAIYQTLNKYGIEYKYFVCEAQRQALLREGKTNKGIRMALEYFYGVKHGDKSKAHGGIGIVKHVYNDMKVYYYEKERERRRMEASLAQKEEEKIITSPIASAAAPTPKKKTYNFEDFLNE